jgi:hypothetical protein
LDFISIRAALAELRKPMRAIGSSRRSKSC